MEWEVEYTNEFLAWWEMLGEEEQEAVGGAVEILQEDGPGLGRPLVDSIRRSRHSNMKELRPRSSGIRVLFIFGPRRMAILLIGDDKTNRWESWYDAMIPIADDLYDEHLATLREEGLL